MEKGRVADGFFLRVCCGSYNGHLFLRAGRGNLLVAVFGFGDFLVFYPAEEVAEAA
jgi:hypothetical protein